MHKWIQLPQTLLVHLDCTTLKYSSTPRLYNPQQLIYNFSNSSEFLTGFGGKNDGKNGTEKGENHSTFKLLPKKAPHKPPTILLGFMINYTLYNLN